MNLDIDISIIQSFIKVAEIGNITEAAEEMHISQPSLSRQMTKLQDSLNVDLFYRVKTGMQLTSEGKLLYEESKKLIASYDNLISAALHLHGSIAGTLNIAMEKSVETMTLDFHRQFVEKYPSVSITHIRSRNENFLESLKTQKIQLAYINQCELVDAPSSLQSMIVTSLKPKVLLSSHNPLASKKSIRFAELKDEKFIFPSLTNYSNYSSELEKVCKLNGFSPRIIGRATDTADYMLKIYQYDAVTVMPYVDNITQSQQLTYIDLEDYPYDYTVSLVWNSAVKNFLTEAYVRFIRPLIK